MIEQRDKVLSHKKVHSLFVHLKLNYHVEQ